MILALITSLALLFDDEREEFHRTGNIVPSATIISFFAASFSSTVPEPSGPGEEAAGASAREFPGWATLGCVRNAAHSSTPSNGHRNSARPRFVVALLVFMMVFSLSDRSIPARAEVGRLLRFDARSRRREHSQGTSHHDTYLPHLNLGWNPPVSRR